LLRKRDCALSGTLVQPPSLRDRPQGHAPSASLRSVPPLLQCLRHFADVPARRLTPPSISSSKPNASPAQRGGMSEGTAQPPSLRDRPHYVCHRMNGGIVRAILWHPIGLEGPKCCHRMNERAVLCILWQGGYLARKLQQVQYLTAFPDVADDS